MADSPAARHWIFQYSISKFGYKFSISNIVKAEAQHIACLVPLFEKNGVPLPPDHGQAMVQAQESFSDELLPGFDAEIANIDMYQRFLSRELPSDVRAVFEHLLTGSQNHLAAFQGGKGGGKNR